MSNFLGFDYSDEGDAAPATFYASTPSRGFDSILQELYSELEGSSKIPFSSTVMIPRERVLELIDELSRALPEELRLADRTNREREAILVNARQESERLISAAKREAGLLVDRRAIVERAKERAQEIMSHAHAQVRTLTNEANEYLQSQLLKFDDHLSRLHTQTLAQREKLRSDPNPFNVEEISVPVPSSPREPEPFVGGIRPLSVAPAVVEDAFYDPDDL